MINSGDFNRLQALRQNVDSEFIYAHKLSNSKQLFEYPAYRRLHNIISNHKNNSQSLFRNNLIKEMLFLLKMVPVMKVQLRQQFLNQIEELYNSNDYKKVDLSSDKLRDFVNMIIKPKDRYQTKARPGSGIPWKSGSVMKFMRPYTANMNDKQNQTKIRPQSSNKGQTSTNYESKLDHAQQCEAVYSSRAYNLLENMGQQDFERNADYINNYRTFHPGQDLPNKKLNTIVDQLEDEFRKKKQQKEKLKIQREIYRSRVIQRSVNSPIGLPKTKQQIQKQQLQENFRKLSKLHLQVCSSQVDLQDQFGHLVDDEESQSKQSKKSIVFMNFDTQNDILDKDKKIFAEDRPQISKKLTQKKSNFKSSLNSKDNVVRRLSKINKESGQRKIIQNRFSQQFLRHKIDFAKIKSKQRKQKTRKYEVIQMKTQNSQLRVLRNQKRSSLASVQSNEQENQLTQQKIIFKYNTPERKPNQKPILIELKSIKCNQKQKIFKRRSLPTFDRKQFFKVKTDNKIKNFLRKNAVDRISNAQDSKIVKHHRFYSQDTFDLISKQNIKSYNQEIMEEIQKAKRKINQQKKVVSFNTLMKGLYINAYDDNDQFGQLQQKEKQNKAEKPKWADIDKGHWMIRKQGTKKPKKKKKRKLAEFK